MISLVIKKDNSALHEQAYFYILYPHSYLIFLQQLKKFFLKMTEQKWRTEHM